MTHNRFGNILAILLGVAVGAIILVLAINLAGAVQQIRTLQHDRELLESQKVGPQGPPPTSAQVLKAVETYCVSHNECVGPVGPTGVQGAPGKTVVGPKGLTGANGDSVASVRCNGTSISFLDSSGKILGTVGMVCLR